TGEIQRSLPLPLVLCVPKARQVLGEIRVRTCAERHSAGLIAETRLALGRLGRVAVLDGISAEHHEPTRGFGKLAGFRKADHVAGTEAHVPHRRLAVRLEYGRRRVDEHPTLGWLAVRPVELAALLAVSDLYR